jgi:hypothetical protein
MWLWSMRLRPESNGDIELLAAVSGCWGLAGCAG